MASNSSAAAVAALFGIRDGDHHQEQIKPLLAQPHQQLPPAPLLNAAASSSAPGSAQAAAAASPPVKKKRTLPGNILQLANPLQFQPCMHIFFLWILVIPLRFFYRSYLGFLVLNSRFLNFLSRVLRSVQDLLSALDFNYCIKWSYIFSSDLHASLACRHPVSRNFVHILIDSIQRTGRHSSHVALTS